MKKYTLTLLFALFLVGTAAAHSAPSPVTDQPFPTPVPDVVRPDAADRAAAPTDPTAELQFGLNFINSVDHPADAQQYANADTTGAAWNRWPLYWNRIEVEPGRFEWADHDAIVTADIAHGYRTNAILLGTPGFYTTSRRAQFCAAADRADACMGDLRPAGSPLSLRAIQAAAPQGLHEPVFADGSDQPGSGKAINADNRWARFVFAIVARYKPGGVLAQANGWPSEAGITHWEMWNEPDFSIFWDSSLPDYARLLKVGYLAAVQADPQAQVLFGGLANNGDPDFYRHVLEIYAADGLAVEHNHFHHIFATHSYSYAWNSWYHTWQAGRVMDDFGLEKPIWLNESGVPAWDDYPGPTWDPQSGLRATTAEQADFLLQSVFYAVYAGADAYYHFQLYDGCGNQPAYTDFPPHGGELCDSNGMLTSDPSKPCAGDANGLFRNPSDAICFSQHLQAESGRPSLQAYRVMAQELAGARPLWRSRPGSDDPYNGPQEWIALYRPQTGHRVIGLWNRFGEPQTAELPARNSRATLILPDGTRQTIVPQNGVYTIDLPPATNQNAFWDPNLYLIGGRTRIVVEEVRQSSVFLPLVVR